MRRRELESTDPAVFEEVAAEAEVGWLGLAVADGTPRVIPLNFAAIDGVVYFHGALAGEKHALIGSGTPCGFAMTKPYSLIPSGWSGGSHACGATHLFKSVEIRGRCEPVEDPDEKAAGLQALMEKYEPGGGYDPVTADRSMYRRALREVGVFRVSGPWTAKVKFGVNEPVKVRRAWIAGLRERGTPLDLATAEEIEKTLEGET